MSHAERVLQPLEALLERRERESQALRLMHVPRGADPEPCPPAAEDVEGGGGLDPQSRRAVVHATDHETDAGTLRVRRDEAERRLALEHRRFGWTEAADLEEMVHDPDRVEADVVGRSRHTGERGADGRRAARPRELVDLEAEFHGAMVPRHAGCFEMAS